MNPVTMYVAAILSSISGYLCADLVNGLEFVMIYKKFAIEIGRRLDVNYVKFCKMVDKFAQNRWDKVYSEVHKIHTLWII